MVVPYATPGPETGWPTNMFAVFCSVTDVLLEEIPSCDCKVGAANVKVTPEPEAVAALDKPITPVAAL